MTLHSVKRKKYGKDQKRQVKEPVDYNEALFQSEFAAFSIEEVPRHELRSHSMPASVALSLIKQELELDGNPALNLASFVSTRYEDEVRQLCDHVLSVNWIDFDEYPQTVDIHNRCVSMIAHLFHAPVGEAEEGVGTGTVGSSEAIMLAVLAMKWRWRKARRAAGKDASRPNMVMGSEVQVCWEKAMMYFDVEPKYVPLHDDVYVMEPERALELCDENTIGVCGILGTTYTGEFEDIERLDALLTKKNKETGWDIGIHVDAASGGFVAPFVYPNLKWDFALRNVRSINVSGHKYGLAPPGIGWVLWRSAEYLPDELVFHVNYLGADQASFTLNFSRGSAQIIASYYLLLRLGRSGYTTVMRTLKELAEYFADAIVASGRFYLLSDRKSLPLVAFAMPDEDRERVGFDEYALAAELRKRGWIVPAYTLAPKLEHRKLLRVVVRIGFTRDRAEMLLQDIDHTYNHLQHIAGVMRVAQQSIESGAVKASLPPESHHAATGVGKTSGAGDLLEELTADFKHALHAVSARNTRNDTKKNAREHVEVPQKPRVVLGHNGKKTKRSGAVC